MNNNVRTALILMATCHTIISETGQKGEMIYNASSPDELALVNFARYVGVEFAGIDNDNNVLVQLKSRSLKYKLLQVLEFSSSR
jgi:phospholipid-transporting ATPase